MLPYSFSYLGGKPRSIGAALESGRGFPGSEMNTDPAGTPRRHTAPPESGIDKIDTESL
ncbi:hypothetical protein IQ238_08445 [Pleurocapsales cyanobacterium LEGE 06147]|nr:hypothetical protein [Pleurocapsales cyanobacterium LEGE 06147]